MSYESIIHKGRMYVDYESYKKLHDQIIDVNRKYIETLSQLASIEIRKSGWPCKMFVMKGGKAV